MENGMAAAKISGNSNGMAKASKYRRKAAKIN
jgi:hypothetical protein